MTVHTSAFEPSFFATQRARLIALRSDLSVRLDSIAAESQRTQGAAQGQANEFEDRAQYQAITEDDRNLSSQLTHQRSAIDRAIAKLDEGSYGFSDVSGLPIPIARLEALPQALLTASEEPMA